MLDVSNIGREVCADSAYRSVQVEARLKEKGLQGRIHRRAARNNRPLSERQKSANTTCSKVRARVEHVFGHQQGAMGGRIGRTIGITRAAVTGSASNPWQMPAWELVVPCMRSSTPGSGRASSIFPFCAVKEYVI